MSYDINKGLTKDTSFKIQSIIILIIILASIVSAIYFYNELQKKNSELASTITKLKATEVQLSESKKAYHIASDSLYILIEKQKIINKDSSFIKNAKRIVEKSNNSDTQIKLHSFKVDTSMSDKVCDFLKQQGYSITLCENVRAQTSWLAFEPTIFYYDEEMKNKAQEIANNLSKLTGINFKVTIGAGNISKVEPDKQLINIHFIGNKQKP